MHINYSVYSHLTIRLEFDIICECVVKYMKFISCIPAYKTCNLVVGECFYVYYLLVFVMEYKTEMEVSMLEKTGYYDEGRKRNTHLKSVDLHFITQTCQKMINQSVFDTTIHQNLWLMRFLYSNNKE